MKGDFNLFALFQREESPDKLDLLASSPWIELDKASALKYITDQLNKILPQDVLLSISRIILLDANDPILGTILAAIDNIRHSLVTGYNCVINEMEMKLIYIITASKKIELMGDETEYNLRIPLREIVKNRENVLEKNIETAKLSGRGTFSCESIDFTSVDNLWADSSTSNAGYKWDRRKWDRFGRGKH